MTLVQRYIFFQVLRMVMIIVGALTLLALLAQGLSRTDIIVESHQSALTYFYIVTLGAPQVIALLTPLALFVATIWALNRIHRDSEIVVAQAAGMTRWQIASPILRLAMLLAVAHLAVNLWVQPAAQRELRSTVSAARADLTAALIRPGQFTSASDKLTFFARGSDGGVLRGILIADARDKDTPVDYLAQTGGVIQIDDKPAILMRDGKILQIDENGALQVLDFEQYTFDLTPFLKEDSDLVLKASDRFLSELFHLDETNHLEMQNTNRYLSEGTARLTTPLLNIAMVMLAIIAVVGGDFSRRGYGRRIAVASAGALGLVIVQLGVQAASADDSALNFSQWLVPCLVILGISWIYFSGGRKLKPLSRPLLALDGQAIGER